MAITTSVKIKGYVQGYGVGRMEIDTAPETGININIVKGTAIGDNTFTKPLGSSTTGAIITIPTNNTGTHILKGAAGDTGIQIATTGLGGTFFFPLASAATGFIINSSVALSTLEVRFI